MANSIGLGVFGSFGLPYGFQQTFYHNIILNQTLDLNSNAIQVFPGTKLFLVKKELFNSNIILCFCIYTFVKEYNSNRGGGFIGSCVLLQNANIKAEDIYKLLIEMHYNLLNNKNNINEYDKLQVQRSVDLIVNEPDSFEKINSQAKNSNQIKNIPIDTRKKIYIYKHENTENHNNVIAFFDLAMTKLTEYDSIYYSNYDTITDYVTLRDLVQSISWQSFNKLEDEKQKHETIIRKNEIGKNKGNNGNKDKKELKNNSSQSVDANNSNVIELDYWTPPNNNKGWNKEEVINKIILYNQLFDYAIILQTKLESFKKTEYPSNSNNENKYQHIKIRNKKRSTIRKHRFLISVLLNISCIIIFFLIRNHYHEIIHKFISNTHVINTKTPPPPAQPPYHNSLTYSSTLGQQVISKLAKDTIRNKSLFSITQLLYKHNPTDIAKKYSHREIEYSDLLAFLNKECFKLEGYTFICICDTIHNIPTKNK